MKILVVLFGLFLTVGAYADDADVDVEYSEDEYIEEYDDEQYDDAIDVSDATVVERVSCVDIKSKIDDLNKVENPDEETLQSLSDLQIEYRTKCVKSGAGRRTSGRSGYIVENTDMVAESVSAPVNTTDIVPEQKKVDSAKSEKKPVEKTVEPESVSDAPGLTSEQMQKNLDSGLCADGTKPNRFGCCGDEIFKDLGNTVFACCPKSGGDCYPPLK